MPRVECARSRALCKESTEQGKVVHIGATLGFAQAVLQVELVETIALIRQAQQIVGVHLGADRRHGNHQRKCVEEDEMRMRLTRSGGF